MLWMVITVMTHNHLIKHIFLSVLVLRMYLRIKHYLQVRVRLKTGWLYWWIIKPFNMQFSGTFKLIILYVNETSILSNSPSHVVTVSINKHSHYSMFIQSCI